MAKADCLGRKSPMSIVPIPLAKRCATTLCAPVHSAATFSPHDRRQTRIPASGPRSTLGSLAQRQGLAGCSVPGVVHHFPLLPHPRAGQPRSHYAGADEPRSSPTVVFGPNGAVSRCACVAGLRTNNRSVDHLSLARIEPARPAEGDTLLSSAFDARPANSPMLLQECHVWRSPITERDSAFP